jgi:hypothetical protein
MVAISHNGQQFEDEFDLALSQFEEVKNKTPIPKPDPRYKGSPPDLNPHVQGPSEEDRMALRGIIEATPFDPSKDPDLLPERQPGNQSPAYMKSLREGSTEVLKEKMWQDLGVDYRAFPSKDYFNDSITPEDKAREEPYRGRATDDTLKNREFKMEMDQFNTDRSSSEDAPRLRPIQKISDVVPSTSSLTSELTPEQQQQMTHQAPGPDVTAPFKQTVAAFLKGGIGQVLKDKGIELPKGFAEVHDFLQREDVNTALGMASPLKPAKIPARAELALDDLGWQTAHEHTGIHNFYTTRDLKNPDMPGHQITVAITPSLKGKGEKFRWYHSYDDPAVRAEYEKWLRGDIEDMPLRPNEKDLATGESIKSLQEYLAKIHGTTYTETWEDVKQAYQRKGLTKSDWEQAKKNQLK